MSPATESPRFRLRVLAVVAVVLFAALFARLWYLQVLSSDEFELAAEANRLRVVQVDAPRGSILDRTGTVLVDNRVSIVVTVDRVAYGRLDEETEADVLRRLAAELSRYGSPATVEDLVERVNDPRYSRYAPVPVAEDVTEELKIYIEEHQDLFPSVAVERAAVRRYPYGSRAAHVIGYLGEIDEEELADRAGSPKSYARGDRIGKTGVEARYERDLRGTPGRTVYEVDASGRPIRVIEELSRAPIPGDDVWLTLDLGVQAMAEDLLVAGLDAARARPVSGTNLPNAATGGAVVVLDPRDGSVVAMASHPTYEPEYFVNGISTERWEYLNAESSYYPISNRATQGEYAPGSTFKLVTSFAAVSEGVRSPGFVFSDQGTFTLRDCSGERCTFSNPRERAYGPVDLTRAIQVSSDTYFYSLGEQFWLQRGDLGEEALQEYARLFGFGEQSGIPLDERSGRLPSPEQRARQYDANPGLFAERNWYTGDNVNMSIGQGDVASTPLQLANAYAVLANGGTRYAPNIVAAVTRAGERDQVVRTAEPRVAGTVEFSEELRASLVEGLIRATSRQGGTAYGSFYDFPSAQYPVAGKTGTAQVTGKADTALFSAFGPAHSPEYVVTVIMEESGFGGTSAAPVARALFEVFAGVRPMPTVAPGGALVTPDGSEEPAVQISDPDPAVGGEVTD